MTTLHFVKKARKSYPGTGIKKGDSYYWWQFAFRERQVSKVKPRRSQLTQSEYLGTMYDHEDAFNAIDRTQDPSDIAGELRSMAEEIRSFGEEQQGKYDNMPDGLQQGETGQLLETRAQECEAIADSLDEAADALDGIDTAAIEEEHEEASGDEAADEAKDAIQTEVDEALDAVGWDYN